MGAKLDLVRAYYAALNRGDLEEVVSYFCENATHYYTTLEPTEGASAIADLAVLAHEAYDACYYIEDAVEDDEKVCIEWTMTWRDPRNRRLRVARGAELYAFEDDRIIEVRSYGGGRQGNRSGELIGFDHAGRGYMTAEGHGDEHEPA